MAYEIVKFLEEREYGSYLSNLYAVVRPMDSWQPQPDLTSSSKPVTSSQVSESLVDINFNKIKLFITISTNCKC